MKKEREGREGWNSVKLELTHPPKKRKNRRKLKKKKNYHKDFQKKIMVQI